VLALVKKIEKEPIGVYVNNSAHGLVDHSKLWFGGVFRALYKPDLWPALADAFSQLLQGNATEAFMSYARADTYELKEEGGLFVELNDGLSGPQHWPQDRKSLLDRLVPFANSSLFASVARSEYYSMQQWLIPRTHGYVPRNGVETAHPLLILSTTYDPICPLVSARSARAAFRGSQIVEVQGYGHCSVAVPSVCAAKHIRAFLYEGKVPQDYTRCKVDAPYFAPPGDGGEKAMAYELFEDDEEQQIHRAQVALARDWEYFHG